MNRHFAILASVIGIRPTLWIAAAGGVSGVLWLLPSPLPRFRMPDGDSNDQAPSAPAGSGADDSAARQR